MFLYVGMRYTSFVVGRQIEQVTCEKCQTQFCYELTRIGTGVSHSPYFLDEASAPNRAQGRAQGDMGKRLQREAEMVPCPKCGWVNEDLIKVYRKLKYRRLPWLAVAIVPVGFFAALFLGAGLARVFGGDSDVPWMSRLALLIVCLSSPAWIFLLRGWLRRRIDPNRTYPQRPVVPLGTPPAVLERKDPAGGKSRFNLVANRYENADRVAGWAVYRPEQVSFPEVCCVCMAPATTSYRSPFPINKGSDFPVPLCGSCLSRIRRRWWTIALAITAVSIVSALALGLAMGPPPPGHDSVMRWLGCGFLALIVAAIGIAAIPGRICRPYRLRFVDAGRDIMKFKAANKSYTQFLIDQVRRSNGEEFR